MAGSRVPAVALALCTTLLALIQPILSATQAQVDRVAVVATFSILGELVRSVGGDRVQVNVLVGPNGDVHSFEPAPGDVRALASARLVVENGLGLERWLDRLYASSRSGARRVIASAGIEVRRVDQAGRHGEPDPHIWSDPVLVMQMVGTIRDALAEDDPANAEAYARNADQYVELLRALDVWIAEQVQTIPARQRALVTGHDELWYFARRYGFEVVGFAIPSVAADVEPSARDTALLILRIRAARVPAIFPENVSDPRLLQRIAAEANVRVGGRLYTDALGEPGSSGDTYIGMMQHNVSAIVSALGGGR